MAISSCAQGCFFVFLWLLMWTHRSILFCAVYSHIRAQNTLRISMMQIATNNSVCELLSLQYKEDKGDLY